MSAPASGGQALVLASRKANDGTYLFGAAQYAQNSGGLWVPVSPTNPMPASLFGSSATGPTLVKTLAFGSVGASSAAPSYLTIPSVLTRGMVGRAVTVVNNTNQIVTVAIATYDSIGGTSPVVQGGSATTDLGVGNSATFSYSQTPDLDAPVDSLMLTNYWKATAGSSGNVEVYSTERAGG